jgi:sugar/nucleoside kinase (ribokinase family)
VSGFVAVVGTVNRDVVVGPGGTRRESLGGILYNAIPLGALLEGTGISVRPIGRLSAADRAEARRILSAFPAVTAETLQPDPAGTNLSLLDYSRGGERVEEVRMRVAPLSLEDLAAGRGARAWLVNMISGRDVDVETVAALRLEERGLFLLDVQALARTADTPRAPRVVPDAAAWSRGFHVVRGSETEIAHLGGAPADVAAAARTILRAGAGEVLATRGGDGVVRFVREGEEIRATETPAAPCEAPVDPTGCGDAFLSAVCAGRVLGLAPEESVRLGTFVAARVLGLSGIESLVALRDLRAEALAFEPRWARAWGRSPRA